MISTRKISRLFFVSIHDVNIDVLCFLAVTGGIIACAVTTGYFSFASLVTSSSNKTGVSILYLLPDRVVVISSAVVLVIHSALVIVPQNSPMFQHTEEVLNIPEGNNILIL